MYKNSVFLNRVELNAAKKYIRELQKRQKDPFGWPDYLTGLPGKSAILKKLDSIYPKLGAYGVSYVRIANIYPYLIKYGYEKHAELISWAAAILQSSAQKHRESFVGTMSTHDFVVIGRAKDIDTLVHDATVLFKRKVKAYYTPADRKNGIILSFRLDNKRICVGLMELISCGISTASHISKTKLIPHLAESCSQLENSTLC